MTKKTIDSLGNELEPLQTYSFVLFELHQKGVGKFYKSGNK